MGKGDRRSRRGKIWRGSFGKTRKRFKNPNAKKTRAIRQEPATPEAPVIRPRKPAKKETVAPPVAETTKAAVKKEKPAAKPAPKEAKPKPKPRPKKTENEKPQESAGAPDEG